MTASALVGASVEATVGTEAQRMPAWCPADFTASMVLPPPMPTITSAGSSPGARIASVSRSTSTAVGVPPKPTRRSGSSPVRKAVSTAPPTRFQTTSSATTSGREPTSRRYSPSRTMAPGPCT